MSFYLLSYSSKFNDKINLVFLYSVKTKRHGLVPGKQAKEYEGISSEFNDEINLVFSFFRVLAESDSSRNLFKQIKNGSEITNIVFVLLFYSPS